MLLSNQFRFLLLAGLLLSATVAAPLALASTIAVSATINSSQQVPTNSSTATGIFSGSVNTVTRMLAYTVTYAGLTPTAAHIHLGRPGVNGPVTVPFSALTSPIMGLATLTQPALDSLLAGRTYINIHSQFFPAGEIRGNIIASATSMIAISASINGSQQVPANGSTATGTFSGALDPATRLLTYTITYAGVTPMAAHIHLGGPGRNGSVKVLFIVTPSPIIGQRTLDQQTVDSLVARRAYVNMHTAAFPNGEVRGNLTTSTTAIAAEVVHAPLTFWPNPAHALVQLTGAPRATVTVLDELGRPVRRTNLDATGTATLDVRGLPAGVYAVRFGGTVRRLVVE